MPQAAGLPPGVLPPGQAALSGNAGAPEPAPSPTGPIAEGLANLTEQEAIELDGMLESNPQITALLMKAFPGQAGEIQHFLKTITSGAEQGGQASQPSQTTGNGAGSSPPIGAPNPLSSITVR